MIPDYTHLGFDMYKEVTSYIPILAQVSNPNNQFTDSEIALLYLVN